MLTPLEINTGADCRAVREAMGLTQQSLASWLGVTTKTVLMWEAGDKPKLLVIYSMQYLAAMWQQLYNKKIELPAKEEIISADVEKVWRQYFNK